MSNDSKGQLGATPSWFIIAVIIVISISIVIIPIYIFVISRSYSLRNIMLIVSSIGSISLSGILAYLYYISGRSQSTATEIQADQKKILDAQKDFTEATYKPEVIIQDWQINNEEIELRLSNIGSGTAKNIRLFTNVAPFPEGELGVRDIQEISYNKSYWHKKAVSLNKEISSKDTINKNVLEAGEKNTRFRRQVAVPETWNSDKSASDLTPASEAISYYKKTREAPTYVLIQFCLIYEDVIENTSSDCFWAVIVEFDHGSLESLLSKNPTQALMTSNRVVPNNAPKSLSREFIY